MTIANFPWGVLFIATPIAFFLAWLLSFNRAIKPTLGDVLVWLPLPGIPAALVVFAFWWASA